MIKQYKVLDRIKEAVERTHPLVVKDIMEKFEKFGTSPVFSVNGHIETIRFKLIAKNELEDLRDEIEKFGFSANDFWFTERDTATPKTGNVYPITGMITITSKKSGKSKEYKTGNKIHWITDFSEDLKKGFYK